MDGVGSPWTVRVYKRILFWKKLISSDWFLNEKQARQFAEQVAEEMGDHVTVELLKHRTPGWTFHRPER